LHQSQIQKKTPDVSSDVVTVDSPSDAKSDSTVAPAPNPPAMTFKELTVRDSEAKLRTISPSGTEMVQVTVFGIKNFEGLTSATVKVEVPGKYSFGLETKPLDGHALCPKSTITYLKPEDQLMLSVVLGDEVYGQASVKFEDFHPSGFEGDLVVGTNNEIVALKLSIVQNGEIQPLEPVVVKSVCTTLETLPVKGAPLAIGPSAPRVVSPEEFQKLCNQPGAGAPIRMTQEEFSKLGC